MTNPTDEQRVAAVLRDMLATGGRDDPPVDPAELRRRATRRTLHRADAKVVAAVAAVVVLVVVLVVAGPLRSGRGPSHLPSAGGAGATTTVAGTVPRQSLPLIGLPLLAAATFSLDLYVVAQTARKVTAAAGSSLAVWDPNIAEHSGPVVGEGEIIVAVIAYGFDPSGSPVQVVEYEDGRWVPVAERPPPDDPGTLNHPDALDLVSDNTAVAVGRASDGVADFLVPFAAAGCGQAPVVSDVGGHWHYLVFTGPFPRSDVLGGNPQFIAQTTRVSDNDCATSVPVNRRQSWTWSYDTSSGTFVGLPKAGWPSDPAPVAGTSGG